MLLFLLFSLNVVVDDVEVELDLIDDMNGMFCLRSRCFFCIYIYEMQV